MTLQEIFQKHTFNFNPFSGITIEESQSVIVPRFNFAEVMKLVQQEQDCIVEFVGKKGRGKTTHLNLLHQLFPQYPIFRLDNNDSFDKLLKSESKVVFIDSIGHLNPLQRYQLFQQNKLFILTTHWSKFLEYKIAGKKYHQFRFKGITPDILKQIIDNRIKLAIIPSSAAILIEKDEANKLIAKFNDDYRGILNHLYEQYQKFI